MAHLPLVRRLAARYARRGQPLEDLFQVGCIGLLRAIDGFDPSRGSELGAYATAHILGEIRRHFRDHAWSVRAPRSVQERYLRLGPCADALCQRLGRVPTLAELAVETGESLHAVREAVAAAQGYRAASLDSPSGEATGEALRESDEEEVELLLARSALQPCLQALPRREQLLVHLRFVEELSQSEIAARLGISQMHVSRLLTRTLGTLRGAVAA